MGFIISRAFWHVCVWITAVLSLVHGRCYPETKFYAQQVDHFDNSFNATFQQQYQINTDHFQPGGPILYYQGAENSVMICSEHTVLLHFAEQLNALVVSLEHRFFGDSIPSNASNIIERYQSLSLDNVMADSVSFIRHIKAIMPGTKNSQTIVFGGSYAGFLSAVQRLNYPDVFYGSLAWGAPMRSFGPDASNLLRHKSAEYLSNVYQDESALAASKIKQSLAALRDRLFSTSTVRTQTSVDPDAKKLVADFNLCSVPKTVEDRIRLFSLVLITYITNAQFSSFRTNNLPRLINGTLIARDSTEVVNATLQIYNSFIGAHCSDWSGEFNPPPWASIAGIFRYIRCRFFDVSGAALNIGPGTIFPPLDNGDGADISHCKAEFNITPPTEKELRTRYHFTQDEIWNSTRILFSVGEIDPVTALAPLELLGKIDANRNSTRMIMVSGGSHVEDYLAPSPQMKDGVKHAQNVALQTIKEWLGVVPIAENDQHRPSLRSQQEHLEEAVNGFRRPGSYFPYTN